MLQLGGGGEEIVEAFLGHIAPEVDEGRRRVDLPRGRRGAHRDGVGDDVDAIGRQAPVDEDVPEEAAGGHEPVDALVDAPRPAAAALDRDEGAASEGPLVATETDRMPVPARVDASAADAVRREQPVVRADRAIVVRGHDGRHARVVEAVHHGQGELVEDVVEVRHVRPDPAQQLIQPAARRAVVDRPPARRERIGASSGNRGGK